LKLNYDRETDSLYIELLPRPSVNSEEISSGLIVDLDGEGRLVGIDVEHASKSLDLTRLETNALPWVKVSIV
jgi:uncharacterized protein YuzE